MQDLNKLARKYGLPMSSNGSAIQLLRGKIVPWGEHRLALATTDKELFFAVSPIGQREYASNFGGGSVSFAPSRLAEVINLANEPAKARTT